MKTKAFKKLILAGIISALAGVVPSAQAASFSVVGQLTGDIRPENPDNLFVDVTIDVSGVQANWTVDINSPLHPSIKLDEFYFNLAHLGAADVGFSAFNPAGWDVTSPATVQGAGGASFMFSALDPSGPPNADDVTNLQDLTFIATLNRAWTLEDFLDAVAAESNDAGYGQMGAHLQSLSIAGCTGCGDSGFAFGNYEEEGGGGGGGGETPEPAMLALMGIGFLSMTYSYSRKRVTC